MMTSHGKLRREKGSLAEYESQMKGEAAPDVHVCMSCASEPSVALCARERVPTCMHECALDGAPPSVHATRPLHSAQSARRRLSMKVFVHIALVEA